MRIITISREFGSGGREIGKMLADKLGYDYYDSEIIKKVAENTGVAEKTVENLLNNEEIQTISLHYYCTFSGGMSLPLPQTEVVLEQKKVIEAIAKKGKNCVIVGRNADAILERYTPFNIFLCADMNDKIDRCLKHRADKDPKTKKEMKKWILSVDKRRALTRELLTGSKWGDKYGYHVILNTSKWDKQFLLEGISSLANVWFEGKEK